VSSGPSLVRLTPRGLLITLNRQRSGSLFEAFAAVAYPARMRCSIFGRRPRADIASAGWKCL
jgi:hypothetical protein